MVGRRVYPRGRAFRRATSRCCAASATSTPLGLDLRGTCKRAFNLERMGGRLQVVLKILRFTGVISDS